MKFWIMLGIDFMKLVIWLIMMGMIIYSMSVNMMISVRIVMMIVIVWDRLWCFRNCMVGLRLSVLKRVRVM